MESFLNEYEIISGSTSHQGASASVYKVRHRTLDYVRAIRVLNQTVMNENDPVYQRFLDECKLLLRLNNGGHPNIVRIAQPRLLQGHALVEMEFVEGEDLNDYILKTAKNFVPIQEVVNFVKDITSALAYCHHDIYKFCINKDIDTFLKDDDEGNIIITPESEKRLIEKYRVIHNDIHSKNVIRKYDGSYILLDFGLAIQNNTVIKSSTRKGGAMEYKAPEKWDDDGNISEQTDIYSLGILMYEMLAGRVPFVLQKANSHKAEFDLSKSHSEEVPPSIDSLRQIAFEANHPGETWQKDYPDWMEEMILKCLEKNPENRFSDAKDLNNFVLQHMQQIIPEMSRVNVNKYDNVALDGQISDLRDENLQLKDQLKQVVLEKETVLSSMTGQMNALKESEQLLGKQVKEQEVAIEELKSNLPENRKRSSSWIIWMILLLIASGACFYIGTIYNEKFSLGSSENVPLVSVQIAKDRNFTYNGKNFVYNGQLSNDQPHGWGTAKYADNSVYEGSFKDGKQEGKGKVTFEDGSYYIGDFHNDNFDGFGIHRFNDGTRYEGQFSNNKITGVGTMYDSSGEVVVQGEFVDGEVKNWD